MALTGGFFSWVVILLTVGAFAAVVIFWPSWAGRKPLWVAGRAGMLLGVNLLVLLTAAVQLNNQFLFFADWADLGGALGGTATTSTLARGGSASKAAAEQVAGPAATSATDQQEPPPTGEKIQDGVTSYQVAGPISGVTATVLVTVPPGYDPTDVTTTYPVLETFSGYPSTAAQWIKTMHLQSATATQVAAHHLHPMIVVSPQLEVPAGTDTECVNGPAGSPQMETFLTRDVPDWLATHFRVRTDRGSWAAIGLSAGGWCSAMAAMLHPSQYGGAIVMGGYFRPGFEAGYDPFTGSSLAGQRYDLVALAHRTPMPLALWVETSHADPVSYQSSTDLLKVARPPLSVTQTVLQNAGHRIGIWQGLLPGALQWLGRTLPGFSARSGGSGL